MSMPSSPPETSNAPSPRTTPPTTPRRGGAVAWMAKNPVASNLLMLMIIVGGILSVFRMPQEVFPEFELDLVTVRVAYPGASPEEVEQGIVLAIEEAVRGIEGVKRVTSAAQEGVASVSIELELGENISQRSADVKNAVDAITTFPENAEEPLISVPETKRPVVSLLISADQEFSTIHALGEKARAELLTLNTISQVDLLGVPPLEISIEVSRETLEAYGLTLEAISQQVRMASVEIPAGGIDSEAGEILVRVRDRKLTAEAFRDVVIVSTERGHDLRLGDIATIRDGFEDTDQAFYYEGKRAVEVKAYRSSGQTPTEVSDEVEAYAAKLRQQLPEGVNVSTWNDDSEILEARIDLLLRNAAMGFVLVLTVLGLFLERRLALWVAMGIPISFLGAFVLMAWLGSTINMISLFALIITLGIVVDDAIVVAENVHDKRVAGLPPIAAAVAGAREMVVPVTFSVLTTIAAFAPLLFVPGVMGKIFVLIPIVVISALSLSLLESFFVLPAHLAHGTKGDGRNSLVGRLFSPVDRLREKVDAGLQATITNLYRPLLKFLLAWRWATLSFGVASMAVVIAMVASGIVPFRFFPSVEVDTLNAGVRLPYGTPVETTDSARKLLETAARKAGEELNAKSLTGEPVIRGIVSKVGSAAAARGPHPKATASGGHVASIEVSLLPSDDRDFNALDFERVWRKHLPEIPGLEALTVAAMGGPSAGAAVDAQLQHSDPEVLTRASQELTQSLRSFASLTNVENSYAEGKVQFDYTLRPEARGVGLTSNAVATSLRAAFYGDEARREQRGRNELKVMVRLPEEQRRSERDLERLLVGTPAGGKVPLATVADYERNRSPTQIDREDGRRIVNVSADLAPGLRSSREILEVVSTKVLPDLRKKYPGLTADFVGEQREQAETMSSLGSMFAVALLAMFALLAIPLRSYSQPLVIMSAIPFGIIGAVVGHLLLGYPLSLMSAMGIIAVSGIVVNDSLVLVDAVNQRRREGMSFHDAVVSGAQRRVRPIILTSATTFLGLMPMLVETSPQAQMLIPMAISLAFGAAFVTVVVLLMVPCLYYALENGRPLASVDNDELPEDAPLKDNALAPLAEPG